MTKARGYKGVFPRLHETVYVEESAVIIGDVAIGEWSSIWCNAVLRGDVNYIRVGSRTNVQDNSSLHVTKDTRPLIIGNSVTIGHGVILHGCTVSDLCLIGMGAIILDGALIGEGSMVAAGALVTEGADIPPRSLVMGMPARVVRTLGDEETARIQRSAENYVDYVRQHLKDRGA